MDTSNVEDIFRLSEPQEAMLGHLLQRGTDADAGFLQLRMHLVGELRVSTFEEAWRRTVARQPVLRTSIHWKDLKHPVQVVARRTSLCVEHRDWRGVAVAERHTRLARLLEEDRRRGIDVTRPPVMRLAIVQEADDRHVLVWTCHHILLDGWSGALVLQEVFDWYDALCGGCEPALVPVRPFKQYVAWLRSQDETAAEHFWRSRLGVGHLDACLAGAPVSPRDARQADGRATASMSLPQSPLEEWARRHRVTLGCVLFGCWGLLLHARTGARWPIFGITVSGRSAAFDGLQSMVGMFANTLPFVLRVDPGFALPDWFREVLQGQQDVQPFEHCSLGRVLEWGGIPLRRPVFDTLVVYANYPLARSRIRSAAPAPQGTDREPLRVVDLDGDVTSTYPLTVFVKPGRELGVELLYDPVRFEPGAVDGILRHLRKLIDAVVVGRANTIGQLLADTGVEPIHIGRGPSSPSSVEGIAAGAPPATPVEAQLMRIFDDLIDIKQIGRDDNFFELGGHSLMVPRLIDRVARDFGVSLPLGVVFDTPTVRGLAGVIESHNPAPSWRSLVGIRERGTRLPLYLVHGLGGEIGYFYNLVEYLHPEQPLYGLQPPIEPFSNLEAMAARYVDEIRASHPRGPYLLGGYCLGGCVAYEMARQLTAVGESVPLVAIIDSASPGSRPRPPTLARRLRRLMAMSPRDIFARVQARAARPTRQAAPEGDELPRWYGVPRAFHAVATRHFYAVRDYRPLPYGGDVWLFRSNDLRFEHDLGWGRLVRGCLRVEMVPGTHSKVLKEPYLKETAQRLAVVVESVSAPLRSSG